MINPVLILSHYRIRIDGADWADPEGVIWVRATLRTTAIDICNSKGSAAITGPEREKSSGAFATKFSTNQIACSMRPDSMLVKEFESVCPQYFVCMWEPKQKGKLVPLNRLFPFQDGTHFIACKTA